MRPRARVILVLHLNLTTSMAPMVFTAVLLKELMPDQVMSFLLTYLADYFALKVSKKVLPVIQYRPPYCTEDRTPILY